MKNIVFLFLLLLYSCGTTGVNKTSIATDEETNQKLSPTGIKLPPAWAFGVLWGGYTNQVETTDRVNRIIEKGFPIDAYWIDSHFWNYQNTGRGPEGYLNFRGDTVAFPDPKAMWAHQKALGIKSGIWVWPFLLKTGNEVAYEGWAADTSLAGVGEFTSTWHNKGPSDDIATHEVGTPALFPKWENPATRAKWAKSFEPLFEAGLDFFKPDSWAVPNYVRACYEATQQYGKETQGRGFVMSNVKESQNPASYPYPAKWSADTKIAWDFQAELKPNGWTKWPHGGFKQNVEWVTSPEGRAYGYPFMTCDGGGYSYGRGEIYPTSFDDELYIRWVQFGAWLPMTEIFSAHTVEHSNLPWKISDRAVPIIRQLLQFRQRLFPYIYSYAHATVQTGIRILRPDDVHLYQYQFGDYFLVGPVVEQGALEKEFFLPEGQWIDYHTGQKYDGKQKVSVPAPLDRMPLMVKAGAILPFRDYHRNIEGGNNQRLTVQLFPSHELTSFTLFEDDGLSEAYLDGELAISLFSTQLKDKALDIEIAGAEGEFEGIPEEREISFEVFTEAPLGKVLEGDAEIVAASVKQEPYADFYCTQIRVKLLSRAGTKLSISIP